MDKKTLLVLVMGALGFSTHYIEDKTGFTPGQIGYILHKADIKRRDYRNGETKLAQFVLKRLAAKAEEYVFAQLPEPQAIKQIETNTDHQTYDENKKLTPKLLPPKVVK